MNRLNIYLIEGEKILRAWLSSHSTSTLKEQPSNRTGACYVDADFLFFWRLLITDWKIETVRGYSSE